MCKSIMDECAEDKQKALEAYEHFKRDLQVEEGQEPVRDISTSKKCMVECLKIAQNSKSDMIKMMGLVMKFEGSLQKSSDSTEDSGSFIGDYDLD